MRHRVVAVEADAEGAGLVVRTRVAPAASDLALLATYRWSPEGDGLALVLEVEPEGEWQAPLPRLGLRLALPARMGHVEWFGRGPGEAYADMRAAARVGRFATTVDGLQTPYVHPQENGNRTEVRWAQLTDATGAGLRLEGRPHVELSARRWTSEALDAARHPTDLVPGDRIWVNADLAQHGLGSASCGPGVLPPYRFEARPATFTLVLRELRSPGA
jgi:beta-galactosidase